MDESSFSWLAKENDANSISGKQNQRAYPSDNISFQLGLMKKPFLIELSVAPVSQGIIFIVFLGFFGNYVVPKCRTKNLFCTK